MRRSAITPQVRIAIYQWLQAGRAISPAEARELANAGVKLDARVTAASRAELENERKARGKR